MRGIFWGRAVGDVGGEEHSVSGAVAAQLQLLLYGNMDFRYSLSLGSQKYRFVCESLKNTIARPNRTPTGHIQTAGALLPPMTERGDHVTSE